MRALALNPVQPRCMLPARPIIHTLIVPIHRPALTKWSHLGHAAIPGKEGDAEVNLWIPAEDLFFYDHAGYLTVAI